MAHIRGHHSVYGSWASVGAADWGYEHLLLYVKCSRYATGPRP